MSSIIWIEWRGEWVSGYSLWFTVLGGSSGSSSMSRGEMSLADVQCHLDKEGASNLVIDLIMNATSDRVFHESILLAIALLEGGNTTIQVRKRITMSWLLKTSSIGILFLKFLKIDCCFELWRDNLRPEVLGSVSAHCVLCIFESCNISRLVFTQAL